MAKSTKRKLEGLSAEEKDPGNAPKISKLRGASRRIRQSVVNEQDEEDDPGRSESQQFLQLSRAFARKQTMRKDNYITSFEEKVRAEGEKLLRVVLSKKKDIEDIEETYQSMLKSLHTTAWVLGAPQSNKNGEELSRVISADRRVLQTMHGLYNKGSYIFKLSAALVSTYEGLCKDVAALDHNLLLEHTWEEDARRVEHLLEGERRIAEERISEQAEKRIGHGGQKALKGEQGQSKTKRERDGWANVAKLTSKGIETLVKALPREK